MKMSTKRKRSSSRITLYRELEQLHKGGGIVDVLPGFDIRERRVLTRAGRKHFIPVVDAVESEISECSESDTSTSPHLTPRCSLALRNQGGVDLTKMEFPKAELHRLPDQSTQNEADSQFLKARSLLTLATLPDSLPCRDSEKEYIHTFLSEFSTTKMGMCLYICGVPGTGKTATTMELLSRFMQQEPTAKFVHLNCLSMVSASDLYSACSSELLGRFQGKQSALTALNEFFTKAKDPTVILLDEMDVLITNKATELYNLFEWCQNGSQLCIIGISNTVDLQERLPPRIQSRMGKRTLIFHPYTKQQMISIVQHRLNGLEVFENMAIQRAAAKVSSVSGDVRRVLQLLQLSIDVYLQGSRLRSKITAHDVGEAISEMFGEHFYTEMNLTERLILAGLIQALSISQRFPAETSVHEIFQRVSQIARTADLPCPTDSSLIRCLTQLKESGVVKIEDFHRRLFERVLLELDEKQAASIICEDSRLAWLRNAFNL